LILLYVIIMGGVFVAGIEDKLEEEVEEKEKVR
jgi:hypothetical protein